MSHESGSPICVYNRRTGRIEQEAVPGRSMMELCYSRPWGRRITAAVLSRHPISRLFGWIQSHPLSRRQIAPFIARHRIDMTEAVRDADSFMSFNDFFTRRLKPGARPVDSRPNRLISPADSRLQVFQVGGHTEVPVKGAAWTLPRLLCLADLDAEFVGGICLAFRLAPCDYHRFGYVDDGIQGPVHTIAGPLHSVNPLALQHKPDILCTNFRQWCLLESEHFGRMLQIEIGAMMVGSVVQHHPEGAACRRGQEKGYFQFGGSTVLVVLTPDRVRMDADILRHSGMGRETLVRYGEAVGCAPAAWAAVNSENQAGCG